MPLVPVHHVLSLLRPILGAFVVAEMWSGPTSVWILPAVVAACASDYFDGVVARRQGPPAVTGRFIDNICDAVFLVAVFWAFAERAVWSAPVWGYAVRFYADANWLPLFALCGSFSVYLLRSILDLRRGLPTRRSRAGHTAGVANYGLALAGAVSVYPNGQLTPWLMEPLFLTVVLLNASAVGENLQIMLLGSDGGDGRP